MTCRRRLRSTGLGLGIALGIGLGGMGPAAGQSAPGVVPDGTLGGENSTVRSALVRGAEASLIEGGASRGQSLFHSFAAFSIGEGQRAYFANPQGIELIFSRVTGAGASNLLGTLGVDGTADLFLLNPNGILFGNNARLDISGSFVGSTAEKLRFADGSEFSASQPQAAPLLTTQDFNPQLWYGSIEANLTNTAQLQTGENLTLGSHQLNIAGGTIQADRDIVLQGSRRFLSGATYTVGGYFFTQDLSGQGINFVIPHSRVIQAPGNVALNANYAGQSLYILAGGAVTRTGGSVTIHNPAAVTTVTPSIANGAGGTQTVTVRSDGKPRLDVRSGLDWHRLGVATPVEMNTSGLGVTFGPGTSGEINFTGTALNNNSSATVGGSIFLASQVQPGSPWAATAAKGNITTGAISTRRNVFSTATTVTGQDSASVQITTNEGNILTGTIDTFSNATSSGSSITSVTAVKAGAIALRTTTGNLTTGNLTASSNATALGTTPSSTVGTLTGGSGGAISLITGTGNLTTGSVTTSSNTTANVSSTTVTGGPGGSITLGVNSGTLTSGNLATSSNTTALGSSTVTVTGGNGGAVGGSNLGGTLTVGNINTSSNTVTGNTTTPTAATTLTGGTAGAVTLKTTTGSLTAPNISATSNTTAHGALAQTLRGGAGGAVDLATTTGSLTVGTGGVSSFSTATAQNTARTLEGDTGGAIRLATISGPITTNGVMNPFSTAVVNGTTGTIDRVTGGTAGSVTVTSDWGNVTLNSSLGAFATATASRPLTTLTGGTGGQVSLHTTHGNLTTHSGIGTFATVAASAVSASPAQQMTGGHAGSLTATAPGGTLSMAGANTFSTLDTHQAATQITGGNGGSVTLAADTLTLTSSLNSFSPLTVRNTYGQITGGNGGNLTLSSATGDLTVNTPATATLSSALQSFTNVIATASPTGEITGGQGGAVTLASAQGNITLAPGSNIQTHAQIQANTGGTLRGGHGGTIAVTSPQAITLNSLLSYSNTEATAPSNTLTQGGNGGAIVLAGEYGPLSVANVFSYSETLNQGGALIAGQGGDLTARVTSGSLTTRGDVLTHSLANSRSSTEITGSKGGDVRLSSSSGSITTGDIILASSITLTNAPSADPSLSAVQGGNGGNITLATETGAIHPYQVLSFAYTSQGNPGFGGNITLRAPQGQLPQGTIDRPISLHTFAATGTTPPPGSTPGASGSVSIQGSQGLQFYQITTQSSHGRSGDVQIEGLGDFTVDHLDIVTSQTLPITVPVGGRVTRTLSFTTGTTGQSGNVALTSTGALTLTKTFLQSSAQGIDPAGNLSLSSAGALTLSQNTRLLSNTTNAGAAGNLQLQSPVAIRITGSGTTLSAATSGTGNAGSILLQAPQLTVEEGASLSTATTSSGQGGSISLEAPQGSIAITGSTTSLSGTTSGSGAAGSISLRADRIALGQGATLSTATSGAGTGGSLSLTGVTVDLTNGGQLLSSSSGSGNSGQISLTATETINLGRGVQNFAPVISVETSGAGQAGGIFLGTPHFILSETARITATATATATNTQGGGSITLQADRMDLAGIVGIFAETKGQAPAGTLTLSPYQANPHLNQANPHLILSLFPGSTLSASTSGSGSGGDLRISAPQSLTITGAGTLAVETQGVGQGGSIDLQAPQLILTDGVRVSASTYGAGRAGNITLTATDFTLGGGASIRTNTYSSGTAGDIKINATGTIDLDNGTIEAVTSADSTGNGGNITIDPITTTLRNGSRIAVDSQGQGTGGNIAIVSGALTLDRSTISAVTRSSNGGNIAIALTDWLRMGNGSLISTEAGTAGSGGNGGDVNITAAFIFAMPNANSDIVANAFDGAGGNINVNTQGIFGFTLGNTNTPRRDPRNNITASSRFGSSGTITAPTVDPSQGLGTLATTLVDPSELIDQRCSLRSHARRSELILAGRGGIAPSPGQGLDLSNLQDDLRLSAPSPLSSLLTIENTPAPSSPLDRPVAPPPLGQPAVLLPSSPQPWELRLGLGDQPQMTLASWGSNCSPVVP